mmetsp:Transcript_1975/g.5033  ORF Transcript_1975/g.5033 Transcript_1975/m.5033 type:complete len:84 (-) Transcript_1975:438-689(-)
MSGATRYKSKLLSHLFENCKVALYVLTPVATVYVLSQPEMMERIVRNRMYVMYPPEGEKPPSTLREVQEYALRMRGNARSPPS